MIEKLKNRRNLAILIAAAVVVYAVMILKLRCFTRQELLDLPMGGRLVRFMRIR